MQVQIQAQTRAQGSSPASVGDHPTLGSESEHRVCCSLLTRLRYLYRLTSYRFGRMARRVQSYQTWIQQALLIMGESLRRLPLWLLQKEERKLHERERKLLREADTCLSELREARLTGLRGICSPLVPDRVLAGVDRSQSMWMMDSGCAQHVSAETNKFTFMDRDVMNWTLADGSTAESIGKGTCRGVHGVSCLPKLHFRGLLSTAQITDSAPHTHTSYTALMQCVWLQATNCQA